MSRRSADGPEAARRRLRARVVREWRGAGEVLDLNARVSQAGDWLEEIMQKVGLQGGVTEEEVIRAWKELAGEAVARQALPVSLRKGCLSLKVLQPMMRFHLEQLKRPLLRRLQEKLGADQVKSIRFVMG
ncbi:MAG: DUF721 domain-containing protein [Verrucomicrobiales bacterium]